MASFRICVLVMALMVAPTASSAADYPIGGGLSVTLGQGWNGTSRQNPAMSFPGMRDLIDDAVESRFHGEGSGALVSYMKLKAAKSDNGAVIDDAGILTKAAKAAYAEQAQEGEFVATVRTTGKVVRSWMTLHAKTGTRFIVAPGYPGGCVTTGMIRQGTAIHNVSIASESCESASHREAVAAFFGG